jgi:NAD-dependent DNA ligase
MHGIWEQIRQTLTTLSNDQTFLNCCKQFDKYGFVFVPEEKKIWGPLTWTSRSVTGSFDWYSRDQLFARLEENGAHTNNEITSKTTHCLIWRNAWSKLAKAQKNNIMCFETLEACKSYFIWLSDLPQPTKKQQNIPQQLSLFG